MLHLCGSFKIWKPEPDNVLIKGDVNGDGLVTMADANLVVNYYLSADKDLFTGLGLYVADCNGDGEITMSDANWIVNCYLGNNE